MKGIYKVRKIGIACVFRSKTVGMLLTSEILQISIDTMYQCELNIVEGSVPGIMRREVSHSIIGGPAPALGTHPVDVLAHILHTVVQYYYSFHHRGVQKIPRGLGGRVEANQITWWNCIITPSTTGAWSALERRQCLVTLLLFFLPISKICWSVPAKIS